MRDSLVRLLVFRPLWVVLLLLLREERWGIKDEVETSW